MIEGGPYQFDPVKNDSNRAKHGIGLDQFGGFEVIIGVILDQRIDYGEARYSAFGIIDGLPYNLVFTPRGDHLRLISFRRAHREEIEGYEGQSDRS